MAKTYCLLNHNLTEKQLKEISEKYNAKEIIYPGEDLSNTWSQIAPSEQIDRTVINNVLSWMKDAEKNDYFIIQGEYGVTFILVDWALNNGLIPMCAISKRIETEVKEGEKVIKKHIFEHVCFRKYERY